MGDPIDLGGRCGECLLFGAIQGLADGLVLVDPEGRVFHVNRRAEEILGAPSRRAMGTRLAEFVRHTPLLVFWDTAGEEDDPVTSELTFPGARAVRATASVCRAADGRPIGRALLLRDVTREKTIQVELQASLARRLVEMAGGGEDTFPQEMPSLTARERQILALLAGGMSNAAMASRLHVSVNTVASHLKHLFAKLRVSSRSEAAAYALARGIRPPRR